MVSAERQDDGDALARAYYRLGTMVLVDRKLDDVLGEVVDTARELVPGAVSVSVTLVDGEVAWTAAHAGELSLLLDERQYRRGHGPCLDAARSGTELHLRDMANETRWPDYTPGAAAAGAACSLSIPLPVQDRVVGALNLYGAVRNAFSEDAIEVARAVASFAAAAVVNATVLESSQATALQMQQAMASRAVIEQAKGLLMGQRRCTAEEAFELLRQLSQDTGRKLREIAKILLDTAQGADSDKQAQPTQPG
jgi:GAF domain-containing protein